MGDRAISSTELPVQQQRIVWGALGASILVVTALPLVLPTAGQDALLGILLLGAGVVYVIPGSVLGRQDSWPRRLVGMALLEAAAVMGLAAWLVAGAKLSWVPGAMGLLGWSLCRPQPTAGGVPALAGETRLPPPIG